MIKKKEILRKIFGHAVIYRKVILLIVIKKNECVYLKNKKQAKNSIKKLSILIPAYNESKTIVGILEKIIRVDLPETIKKEIIIIDDCSTDHTDEKVAQVMKSHSEMYIKYIRLKENRGKGYAYEPELPMPQARLSSYKMPI